MAKTDNPGLNGKVGNLVHYSFNGKSYARATASFVKIAAATKKAATGFGGVKAISANLRNGLGRLLDHKQRSFQMYRMDEAVRKWMKEDHPNTGDEGSNYPSFCDVVLTSGPLSLQQCLGSLPEVVWKEEEVILTLPALDFQQLPKPYPGPDAIRFCVGIAESRINERHAVQNEAHTSKEVTIENERTEAIEIKVPYTVTPGTITIAVLRMWYGWRDYWMEEEEWQVGGVVGSYFKSV